jgi:Haem-NO-binding
MHGIIHFELKKFVEQHYGGHETWDALLKNAGLSDNVYLPNAAYPDDHLVNILQEASKATGKSIDALQREFGEFIVPDLVRTYGAYIRKEWKLLDFLEHIEEAIHGAVRRTNPGAAPPQLSVSRVSPQEVIIEYNSARKMFGVLHGILNGVIKHYQENVQVKELTTLPSYKLSVRLA